MAGGDSALTSFTSAGASPPAPAVHADHPISAPRGGPSNENERERFRAAAAGLLAADPVSEAAREFSIEAAAALLAAAEAGDPGLGRVLQPDPDEQGPVTWTVACYQIGDLSPTTLKDFADPSEAVQAAARCPEIAHVAAELLASTASGLRWTALIRTGELLRFQLLETGSARTELPGPLLDALEHRWAAALTGWAAEAPATARAPGRQWDDAAPAVPGEIGVAMGQVLEAVQGLARRVDDLVTAQDVMDRLNAIEQRMIEVQIQLGFLGGIASAQSARATDFAPIDAEASVRPPRGLEETALPAVPLHRAQWGPTARKRVSDALSRAAIRGLAAARRQQPPTPPTGWSTGDRGSG